MTGRVAIVHDYLTQRGGAERVVLAMARALPDAPVYTTLYEPASTYPEFRAVDVRPSPLSRVGLLRRHHRLAFPVLAPAVRALRPDADVVICSSSGWAHGVRTSGRVVVYCYAPARWLYQAGRAVGDRRMARLALGVMARPLRRWDAAAARRAARYLTTSRAVAAAIADAYGIEAEVVAPPVTFAVTGPEAPVPGVGPGALLCVSRLLPYKNVDAVVAAFAALPEERLVVVGDGPDRKRIARQAPVNVTVTGPVTDAQLRWLYRRASGLIGAAYEDFGLTPLEAAAFGCPAAVLRGGGYLDTVVEGCTGVMFDVPTPTAVARAVGELRAMRWDPTTLRAHAARFSEEGFAARLRAVVAEVGT